MREKSSSTFRNGSSSTTVPPPRGKPLWASCYRLGPQVGCCLVPVGPALPRQKTTTLMRDALEARARPKPQNTPGPVRPLGHTLREGAGPPDVCRWGGEAEPTEDHVAAAGGARQVGDGSAPHQSPRLDGPPLRPRFLTSSGATSRPRGLVAETDGSAGIRSPTSTRKSPPRHSRPRLTPV